MACRTVRSNCPAGQVVLPGLRRSARPRAAISAARAGARRAAGSLAGQIHLSARSPLRRPRLCPRGLRDAGAATCWPAARRRRSTLPPCIARPRNCWPKSASRKGQRGLVGKVVMDDPDCLARTIIATTTAEAAVADTRARDRPHPRAARQRPRAAGDHAALHPLLHRRSAGRAWRAGAGMRLPRADPLLRERLGPWPCARALRPDRHRGARRVRPADAEDRAGPFDVPHRPGHGRGSRGAAPAWRTARSPTCTSPMRCSRCAGRWKRACMSGSAPTFPADRRPRCSRRAATTVQASRLLEDRRRPRCST